MRCANSPVCFSTEKFLTSLKSRIPLRPNSKTEEPPPRSRVGDVALRLYESIDRATLTFGVTVEGQIMASLTDQHS